MRQANLDEIKALPYAKPFLDGSLKLFYIAQSSSYMGLALIEARTTSTDKKHPTGAVIVIGTEVVSRLSNQAGYKNPVMIWLHEKGLCLRRILRIPSGQKYHLCHGCAKPSNHAESRVSVDAHKRRSQGLGGADLYLWGHYWCCKDCCEAMIKAGVSRVILLEGAKEKFGR